MSTSVIWRLKSGADRRFRAGHPWVYSNELAESPKGIEPGVSVELRDAAGKFLARGYGNPHSLIAFRCMSRDASLENPLSPEGLFRALTQAWKFRSAAGLSEFSFRLCFGEADQLPGLVIDRYRLAKQQVFVIQAHTAGMNRIVQDLPAVLERLVAETRGISWAETAIVLRNDVGVRQLEGVTLEEPRVLKEISASRVDLTQAVIRVASADRSPQLSPQLSKEEWIEFQCDLIQGQKTGFFLDQAANIQLAALRLAQLRPKSGPLRILDLCCYAGQWSAQLASLFGKQGVKVHVTLVDASASALELARKNVTAQGAACETLKADVLRGLGELKDRDFDLVVCDPPALIKGRKDIPAGTHAYLQLNTQVFRLVREGGGVVTCSCSALLDEESFSATIAKAARRNQRTIRWVARGTQSPDHPVLLEFPEGRYLKCWIGFDSIAN